MVAFFASFPFTNSMYIPQHMPFFQVSHVYQGIDIPLFCHCKPKKGAGIQNGRYSRIAGHQFYVHKTGNLICFHFICFYLRIKLTRFCVSFRKRNKFNFEPNKTTVIIIIMIPLGQRARITMFRRCLASRKHLLNSIGHQLV